MFVDSIDLFDCRLPGVVILKQNWLVEEKFAHLPV